MVVAMMMIMTMMTMTMIMVVVAALIKVVMAINKRAQPLLARLRVDGEPIISVIIVIIFRPSTRRTAATAISTCSNKWPRRRAVGRRRSESESAE